MNYCYYSKQSEFKDMC